MAGTVYLKTEKFEVKLEGITFKVTDFEPLCTIDFLFPKGKVWAHPPVVGIDVMRHPRNPSIGLLLLCFGIGCVILKFHVGDDLPDPILKFLRDERISLVGFGIPEKKDLFPFEKLGLKESNVDVGHMAAKLLNDPKLKKCELADLARRVIGVKKMVGLTEAGSFARHEQIKIAICEVFVSSVIAMTLLAKKNEKKFANSAKESLFMMNLDPPFKIPTSNKENNNPQTKQPGSNIDDARVRTKGKEDIARRAGEDSGKGLVSPTRKPVKGILKCSSTGSLPHQQVCCPPPKPKGQSGRNLKRANSKGHNVSFTDNHCVRLF